MDEIRKLSGALETDHVRKWKAGGGKVLGYTCIATPVELVAAAGVLPYRVRALGSAQTEIADAHLSRFNCSFCRSCLQLGLDGSYDFLDGMIETNGCDHLRGMIENWKYAKGFGFFHYLRVPQIVDKDSFAFFVDELKLMRRAMSDFIGAEVDDDAVRAEIERQERIRGKLRRLYSIRERERPGLTGAEALEVFLAATASTTDVFEAELDRIIREREGHEVPAPRARLVLGGSATDEVDFVREIEDVGGLVVTDMLCFGSRAFWTRELPQQGSPEEDLARLYLGNQICPRMFDEFHKRRDFIFSAVERARADGVVLVHNKFCDIHGVDNVQLRMALEKKGVPVLQLEKEYGARADLGRIRTRVQAFLERIGDAK
ncbi:MAG TPA: 2-hydroxyacyl-CoA dehydratase family protein [bacterium]|nr:2-hydroxyacyl-CoA dehydratase family protein [bacterium]